MGTTIELVKPEEIDGLLGLLTENQLPLDGLREHLATSLIARVDGRVVGSAALEVYPGGTLLRSVAVGSAYRGNGLGRQLIEAALQLAQGYQTPAIYLLTTTAEGYFPRFGFESIPRSDVPATVQTSIEFRSACPSTAIVMRKRL